MNRTRIETFDYTWNPVTGCYGPGGTAEEPKRCSYCYAMRGANRFKREFKVDFHPDRLNEPSHLRKPQTKDEQKRIFVGSVTDMFGEGVKGQWVNAVWNECFNNNEHFFFWLTKNPAGLLKWTEIAARAKGWPIEDIWPDWFWLGVTVTDQADADERIPVLLSVPAEHRFISVEPMLGPVDIRGVWPARNEATLDWCVIGAQTGAGAKPIEREWVTELTRQCALLSIPVFHKNTLALYGFGVQQLP